MMDRGWLFVLLGLLFILTGCGSVLGDLRSAWNTTNANAVDLEIRIGEEHQAELDAIVEDTTRSKEEKLAAVDAVEAKYAPAYEKYRALRAALATTRTALKAAELAEQNGEPPSPAEIAELVRNLLAAYEAAESAIP